MWPPRLPDLPEGWRGDFLRQLAAKRHDPRALVLHLLDHLSDMLDGEAADE